MARAIGLINANYFTKADPAFTLGRPLASLPVLGRYRMIDFALSNMANCCIRNVGVILPTNYRSIADHLGAGKEWSLDRKNGGLFLLPGSAFGTARRTGRFLIKDLLDNKAFLERSRTPYVVVSSASFIYNMSYTELVDAHEASGADVTMVTAKASADYDDMCGVVAEDGRVTGLTSTVKLGDTAFMDLFVIGREFLLELLENYREVEHLDLFVALHDDLKDDNVRTYEYNGYSAAVLNGEQYFATNMALLDPNVQDKLFPADRPIITKTHDTPPAKYGSGCHVANAMVSSGDRIHGTVSTSVLGRNVIVEEGASVVNSIILQGVTIAKGAKVENAIIDRNLTIAAGTELRGTQDDIFIQQR
jgi:glucose-1-phosphate adenylyltransferase